MMFENFIMAAMSDELVYECYDFRGHIFRRYPSGRICEADEYDKKAAARMKELKNKWGSKKPKRA